MAGISTCRIAHSAERIGADSFALQTFTETSKWVDLLNALACYVTFLRDKIPDFSGVGYLEGADLPSTTELGGALVELEHAAGDQTARIQAALDALADGPVDAVTGFRGALRLGAGTWDVSETLVLDASGVVLQGAAGNDATVVRARETGVFAEGVASGAPVLLVAGAAAGQSHGPPVRIAAPRGARVPVGSREVPVVDAASFVVGEEVLVQHTPNAAWIAAIGMDDIQFCYEGCSHWTAPSHRMSYYREITAISGNTLTLNLPLTQAIADEYGGGSVYKYAHAGRISKAGVRDLTFVSAFSDGPEDETHAWSAVHFTEIRHGFAENVRCWHFGGNCVGVLRHAHHITVKDCHSQQMISKITGGRRYSFFISGSSNLVEGCTAESGRHDFTTGSRVAGPNVFRDCHATNAFGDIGPHHR